VPPHRCVQHREDDPTNEPDTPFDFTEENYVTVERILAKYPDNYKMVTRVGVLALLAGAGVGGADRVGSTPRRAGSRARTRPRPAQRLVCT
jgi:hypothetical protein